MKLDQDFRHRPLESKPFHFDGISVEQSHAHRIFSELSTAPSLLPPGVTPIPADLPGPAMYYLASVWSPDALDPPDTNADKTPGTNQWGRFG
jgi:hypothetical protein